MIADGLPRALPTVQGERGVCTGGHPAEAEAGRRMLEGGGNAIDAAVAAAFVGFVVEQLDCGIGGFAHVSVLHRGELKTFDGYVRAPGRAHPTLFEPDGDGTYYGHPGTKGDLARHGALAVAVPGAVAALCDAQAECGALARSEVLAPAVEAAESGIPFSWRDKLAISDLREVIERDEATAAALLPKGRPPHLAAQRDDGERMDGTALAHTLRRIAERGKEAFYEGEIAEALSAHVQARGGILEAGDLRSYRVRRGEQPARYRGHRYVTCFDGVGRQALSLLEGFEIAKMDPHGAAYRHLMAEVLGMAFRDNLAHFGDPRLCDPEVIARRRDELDPRRALPRPLEPTRLDPASPPPEARLPARQGTSQMVAADGDGNLAAICTAVGWCYGSLVYVPEVGAFLNNGMSYFDPRPGRRASIAPGKTPLFGAPTLVMEGAGGAYALAGSGGYRIETAVLHSLLGMLEHRMDPAEAVAHPRVHAQGGPTYFDGRIPRAVREALAEAGHQVEVLDETIASLGFGRVCAVRSDGAGCLSASAGPPWIAGALGC